MTVELACRHACRDEEEDVLARIRRAILESIIFRSDNTLQGSAQGGCSKHYANSSARAKEKENVRRTGVEPTTSSARTSPRCLRGGPRRSLYKRQHTLEDKGDLDSKYAEKSQKSVQKSVQKSREFCFLACQKSHGMPQKKEKKKGVIFDDSRDLMLRFFFDSNILFTCAG